MDSLALTEFLIKSIIKDPDLVSVKQFEDDEFINIEVLADSSIIGTIIGKKGNIINSVRTIVQASSYVNKLKKVKINIESF